MLSHQLSHSLEIEAYNYIIQASSAITVLYSYTGSSAITVLYRVRLVLHTRVSLKAAKSIHDPGITDLLLGVYISSFNSVCHLFKTSLSHVLLAGFFNEGKMQFPYAAIQLRKGILKKIFHKLCILPPEPKIQVFFPPLVSPHENFHISSCTWHIVVNALPCAWHNVVKPIHAQGSVLRQYAMCMTKWPFIVMKTSQKLW